MGISLCKEKSQPKPKTFLQPKQENKTRISRIESFKSKSKRGSVDAALKSKISITTSRRSEYSLYYSCIANDQSLGLTNSLLMEDEEHSQRTQTQQLDPRNNQNEVHEEDDIRKKNDSITIGKRTISTFAEKLKSISDRGQLEESIQDENDLDSEEGFYEPNSFFADQPELKDIQPFPENQNSISTKPEFHKKVDSEVSNFSILSLGESIHAKCLQDLKETFALLENIFNQDMQGFQKVYEKTETPDQLLVRLRSSVSQKGLKMYGVCAEWYIPGNGEELMKFINSSEGLSKVLKDIGTFTEHDSFCDELGQKYSIYEMCASPNTKNPIFIKSYKCIEQDTWLDAFKMIDCNDFSKEREEKNMPAYFRVGGHVIFLEKNCPNQENRYKMKVYFESIDPNSHSHSQLLTIGLIVEKVQSYANECIESAKNLQK